MLAKLQPEMPEGEDWTYEPKWDGFRTIVSVDADGTVQVVSRDGRPLGRYFPELDRDARVVGRGPFMRTAEIVRVDAGSMDFDELQLRLHPAESRVRKLAGEIPATLVAVRPAAEGDEELTALPLVERRARLGSPRRPADWGGRSRRATSRSMPPAPIVLVAPWTGDRCRARAWFDDDDGLGQDGVLAKRTISPTCPVSVGG